MSSTTTHDHAGTHDHADVTNRRRLSTETKASVKTSELIAYVVVAIGILVASAVVDSEDFGAQDAWFLVTLLTIGYLVSRGLAKSGSRDFYDDSDKQDTRTHR